MATIMWTLTCHLACVQLLNCLVSAIHCILQSNQNVKYLLYYLDDFFTAEQAGSSKCQQNVDTMLHICSRINAPIKCEKL